jgi:hypothetical protein
MARACAEGYVKARAARGFDLLPPARARLATAAFEAHLEDGVNAAALAAARAVVDVDTAAAADADAEVAHAR